MTGDAPDPRERARTLLRTMLDPEQREDLLELGGFRVRTPDHLYWVPLTGTPFRSSLGEGRVESLCVGPDDPGRMPPEDLAITLLTWIRTDPPAADATANVLSRRPVPRGTGEDDLVRIMALQGRRLFAPIPVPHPPRRPGPVLGDQERRDLLARVRLVQARVRRRVGDRAARFPSATTG